MAETASLLATATRDLARFAAELDFTTLPPDVVRRAKAGLLDGIGVCLHGASLPWTQAVQDMLIVEGGNGVASIWGRPGELTSWSQAVLANSTAGHAAEMDDIHKDPALQPNSITVPIALGYAEMEDDRDGSELLTAIVVGCEIGARVGNAATTGTLVAGATAGKLYGLSATQTEQTLGIAGSMAGGLVAAQEGAMVRGLHCGRAAQSGVYAALLARQGITGAFQSSLSRQPDTTRLTGGLGSDWEMLQVGYKRADQASLESKFRDNVRHCLLDADAERVIAIVSDFERLDSAAELIAILNRADAG